MNCKALICNSNMYVPYVMVEVLNNPRDNYVVLSDIENIILFFNSICIPNVVCIAYGVNGFADIWNSKKTLMAKLSKWDIARITFYNTTYGGLANWLICTLHKQGVAVQHCSLYPRLPFPKAKWYQCIKLKLINYLMYGVRMEFLFNGDSFIPELSQRFFKRNEVEIIRKPDNIDIATLYFSSYIRNNNLKKSVLFLTGSVVESNVVDEDNYVDVTDRLIKTIGFERIMAKQHPRFNKKYGIEKNLPEVPSYIPGNLILSSYDIVIGHSSLMLVEAAQQGKIVISTLFLYNMGNKELTQNCKKYLECRLEEKGVIYYPSTIQELVRLLHNS